MVVVVVVVCAVAALEVSRVQVPRQVPEEELLRVSLAHLDVERPNLHEFAASAIVLVLKTPVHEDREGDDLYELCLYALMTPTYNHQLPNCELDDCEKDAVDMPCNPILRVPPMAICSHHDVVCVCCPSSLGLRDMLGTASAVDYSIDVDLEEETTCSASLRLQGRNL